jgi:hypothetical protein
MDFRKRHYNAWCRYVLWATVRQLHRLQPGELPSRDVLVSLRKGWNNNPWTAQIGLLDAIAQHVVNGKGPILECGSGATTILIGALARANDREAWSLEEQEPWARRVAKVVDGRDPVQVIYSPIVDYGAFEWYEVPSALPEDISLVVCDGPRSWRKGGRSGVYEMMSSRFSDDCVILMDDAQRAKERNHMRDWHDRFGAEFEIVRSEGRPYGLVRPGARVRTPPHPVRGTDAQG